MYSLVGVSRHRYESCITPNNLQVALEGLSLRSRLHKAPTDCAGRQEHVDLKRNAQEKLAQENLRRLAGNRTELCWDWTPTADWWCQSQSLGGGGMRVRRQGGALRR